jgi:polyhydroxyalkanoate synthesis regulator phasin
MEQEERQQRFGRWLRWAWNAVVRTAEAMEQTPFDELFDRVNRLERQAAALKECTARSDGTDIECALNNLSICPAIVD